MKTFLTAFTVFYLLTVFINWDFNPFPLWTDDNRGVWVIGGALFSFIVWVVRTLYLEEGKKSDSRKVF